MLGDGGEPRGHETVPGEGGAYWSLCVPMGGARSGLAGGVFWGLQDVKNEEENERFYGFTDFRGKPARRGRGSRATANQVTAGNFQKLSRKKVLLARKVFLERRRYVRGNSGKGQDGVGQARRSVGHYETPERSPFIQSARGGCFRLVWKR